VNRKHIKALESAFNEDEPYQNASEMQDSSVVTRIVQLPLLQNWLLK